MGGIERIETKRGSSFLFDSPMVLLNDVVEVFTLPNFDRRSRFLVVGSDSSGILIYIDFHRSAVVANSLAQKTQSRFRVSLGGQQEVDGVTMLIHSSIKVFPLTTNFDVSLIEAPTNTNASLVILGLGRQQGCVFHNPTINR